MSEEINVRKVAKLARLKLKTEEEEYFKAKFKNILDYVSQISEVKIDSDMKEKDESLLNTFRPDQKIESDISADEFSPYVENRFFKVPKVIE